MVWYDIAWKGLGHHEPAKMAEQQRYSSCSTPPDGDATRAANSLYWVVGQGFAMHRYSMSGIFEDQFKSEIDLIQIYFRCNYLSTFSKIQSHPWKSNPKMSSLNQWPLCVPGFGWDLFITRTEIPSPRWPAKCGAKFGITSLLLACNLG